MSQPADMTTVGSDLYAAVEPLTDAEESLGYPLANFLSSVGLMLEEIATLVRADDDGNDGWTGFADPSRCPDSFLYTLAVWAGVTYPRRMSKDDLRALIGPHAPGVWRGTKAAILAAIERYLPKPFDPEIYRETALADKPVAYYTLGESPGAATVADVVAGLDATVTGAQVPNLMQGIGSWPSFESGVTGMRCDGGGTVTAVPDFAVFGKASALVTAGSTPTSMDLYAGINARVPVTPGEVVVFSFYSRAVATNRPSYASLQFYRGDGTQVSAANGVDVTDNTTAWARPSVRAVVPAEAVSALPVARWRNVIEGEQHYCDAGQFTKTNAAVPYCDNVALQLGVSGAIPASADTALELQDPSGYITVPHPAYLLTPAFSLEMWVWITPGTTHETLWDLAWGGAGHLVRVEASGALIFFIHTTSNSNDYVNVSTPTGKITGARWQHTVCTFDTDMIQRVYVDGELAATSAVRTGVWVPPSGALYFGGHYSAVFGRIDEAAIYTYALTPAQVAAHYNTGLRQQVPANPESMIYFEERADGDAYKIRIFTYEHWTLDAGAIRAELLNQIPAGLLLDYEVRVGQTYGMVRDTHPTYADVKAAYATYADMTAAPPPAAPSE